MSIPLQSIYFCSSFLLCMVLTFLILKVALVKNWIVLPSTHRWHTKPTAQAGGCAIFASILVCLFILPEFTFVYQDIADISWNIFSFSLPTALILGVSIVFAMGLYDDFNNVPPHIKISCQIIAAAIIIFSGHRLNWLPTVFPDSLVTLFWIVGITNGFNLIDNMDGLCAGVSCIASLSFAVLLFAISPEASLIAIIIAGSSAGFLVYNFYPAKIFMGDCGSQVLGFSISVLALCIPAANSGSTLIGIVVPVLVLIVPVLDTTLVTLNRLLSGRSVFKGGCDHTSHRMVLVGCSEKKAVLCLYATGVLFGVAANFVSSSDLITALMVIIPLLVFATVSGIYLSNQKITF
jgi:UDP-GlcNAc:undecaprenyl-phosphate/decaprenyl-phosphate GlcNAc-1-phosphate transferase